MDLIQRRSLTNQHSIIVEIEWITGLVSKKNHIYPNMILAFF